MEGAGKSNATFFVSADCRLLLKSATAAEARTLLGMLGSYLEHIARVPHTLLPRFYGLVQLGGAKGPCFIVLENFFSSAQGLDERFDLKGALVGRHASAHERTKGVRAVLKDLDWSRRHREPLPFDDTQAHAALADALERDAAYLAQQGLIDYSLVVGISSGGAAHGARASHEIDLKSGGVAVFGIIDVLTHYSAKKRLENLLLGKLHCGREISCQPPRYYARRFVAAMQQKVLGEIEAGAALEGESLDGSFARMGGQRERELVHNGDGASTPWY